MEKNKKVDKKVNKKEVVVKEENTELSYEIKTVITVILLVTAYPVGVIMMLIWMKWPVWVKALVCAPFILVALTVLLVLGIIGAAIGRGVMGEARYSGVRFNNNDKTRKEMLITPSVVGLPKYKIINY